MQIGAVRRALADAVRDPTIAGLNALGYMPGAVDPPVFVAGEVELDPNYTYAGSDEVIVTCYLLVSSADEDPAQELLDEYMSRSGVRSVRAALLAARGGPGEAALGGLADDLGLVTSSGWRMYQVGEKQYFGSTLRVRVVGS